MIKYETKWHWFLRKSSALFDGSTANISENFYCFNCLHFFQIEKIRHSHESICKIITIVKLCCVMMNVAIC